MTRLISTNISTTATNEHAISDGDQSIYILANVLVSATGIGAAGVRSSSYVTLSVSGTVYGNSDGVLALGSGNYVSVASSGSIVAAGDGIELKGSGRIINAGFIGGDYGIYGSAATGSFNVTNSGDISGTTSGITLYASAGYSTTITNSGTISGSGYAIVTGSGNDLVTNTGMIVGTIFLGSGDDVYDGRQGTTSGLIMGSEGNDTLYGGDQDDLLDGGNGADNLYGGSGNDSATYQSSTFVTVDMQDVSLNAGAARGDSYSSIENILGSSYADTISGDAAANILKGYNGDDILSGRNGNDVLDGQVGADTMIGGLGNDTFYVDNIYDNVVERTDEGNDRIFSSVSYTLAGRIVETLTLTGIDAINATGNSKDNILVGNSGANVLKGFDGNDVLDGSFGTDTMVGGNGNDTYYVNLSTDIVTELDGQGTDTIFSSASYTLSGRFVETLVLTGTSSTSATGNSRANTLIGNNGLNVLQGLDGADTLDGGLGNDTLTGGGGQDLFRFSTALVGNVDTIVDFSSTDDTIQLDDAIFQALTPGALAASAFYAGGAAHDASDRIIFDSSTGMLSYDEDGTGDIAAIGFGTLAVGLTLTATDFAII